MTSAKKIAANQNNANYSRGARTKAGKERSRMNAKTHGIFVKELLIPDKDKPQFVALQSSFRDQLKPASTLQNIAFERILAACWRYKLATRLEMKRLGNHLASTENAPLPESQSQTAAQEVMGNRYTSSSADLRNAEKLLVEVGQDVAKNGWIHKEQWRDRLTNAFGTECFNLLTAWDPVSVDAILLAQQNIAHSERFGLPLPPISKEGEGKNLVVDPNANWQMSCKLIDLLRLHVEGLMRMKAAAAEASDERQSANTLDLGARYATTATRDLERAVL
jgi:hypothetical protein